MKNNLLRGIRKASDFLMALQLTGAFKRERLREPPGAPARRRHRRRPDGHRHGDRADGVLPAAGREDPRPLRGAVRRVRRAGHPRRCSTPRSSGLLDEFLAHGRAVRAERARAAAAGEPPDFVPLMRALGRRVARLPQGHARLARLPAEPRGDHQVARGRHPLRRADEPGGGHPRRVRPRVRRPLPRADQRERQVARGRAPSSRCRRARCSSPPARRPTSRTSGSTPARSSSTSSGGSSSRTSSSAAADGAHHPRAGAGRVLHLLQPGRPLRHLLRRQPPEVRRQRREGDGVGARRLPARRRLVPGGRRAKSRSPSARRGTRTGGASRPASTTTSSPASNASSA